MPARGAPTCRNDGRTGHGARLSHRTTTRPAQPSAHKHTATPTTQSQDRHAHAVAVLARQAVVDIARSWGITGDGLDDIAVVAGELLANAVIHAPGRLLAGVYLSPDGDRVVIEVYDPSRRMPTGAANFGNSELTCGRGILMIESLSESWGAEPTTHGKKVWAELAVPAVVVPDPPRAERRAALGSAAHAPPELSSTEGWMNEPLGFREGQNSHPRRGVEVGRRPAVQADRR
ncbi:ATP-binding protein [Kitasatospora sp. MAP12-22]|uniref:ATP-binding protein n=1 Tax=unclassified Kitasatospora TaxID=2633591 RepID=UPI003512CECB